MVQHLLGLPTDTPNPHLWYSPTTMPAAAKAMAAQLSALQPSHAAYFAPTWRRSTSRSQPWLTAISAFKAKDAGDGRSRSPSPSPTTSSRRWG